MAKLKLFDYQRWRRYAKRWNASPVIFWNTRNKKRSNVISFLSNDKIDTTRSLRRNLNSRCRQRRSIVLQRSTLGTAHREHRHRPGVCCLLLEIPEMNGHAFTNKKSRRPFACLASALRQNSLQLCRTYRLDD